MRWPWVARRERIARETRQRALDVSQRERIAFALERIVFKTYESPDVPLDFKLAARQLHKAALDIQSVCTMLGLVVEPFIADDKLPADRLAKRLDEEQT